MARRKVSPQFRARLSEKLMELGNLVVITLAFGQFLGNKEFSAVVFFWGVILAIICYIISYVISS